MYICTTDLDTENSRKQLFSCNIMKMGICSFLTTLFIYYFYSGVMLFFSCILSVKVHVALFDVSSLCGAIVREAALGCDGPGKGPQMELNA